MNLQTDFNNILATVREVVSNLTAIPENEIGDTDNLVELLALDSLNMVVLGLGLEEKFSMIIPSEDVKDLISIEIIAEYISRKTSQEVL